MIEHWLCRCDIDGCQDERHQRGQLQLRVGPGSEAEGHGELRRQIGESRVQECVV